MADPQGSVERPVRNAADVEFFFVAGMAAGGTRPTVARREFRDWLTERDRKAAVEALREAAQDARLCWTGTTNLRDRDDPEKAYSFDAWLGVRAEHLANGGA